MEGKQKNRRNLEFDIKNVLINAEEEEEEEEERTLVPLAWWWTAFRILCGFVTTFYRNNASSPHCWTGENSKQPSGVEFDEFDKFNCNLPRHVWRI